MVDRVFFAKTGHTIFIPKATVVRGSFFWASNVTRHRNRGLILTPILVPPSEKKSCAEFIQVQEFPEKMWGFSCCRPAENQEVFTDFTQTSHHHITGKTWHLDHHLDTCHQTRPWSIQLHQLHSSHGQCYPSRIPTSVNWTDVDYRGCGCLSLYIYKSLKMFLTWPKFLQHVVMFFAIFLGRWWRWNLFQKVC